MVLFGVDYEGIRTKGSQILPPVPTQLVGRDVA